MSKKTSPQLSAPITPFSSMARSWSSREADFSGGLASISSITEKALSRAAPTGCCPLRGADLGVVGLQLVELAGVERAHLPRQRVGRRALEHREVLGLLRHDRDQLHAGRTGADDADPLAGEVDSPLSASGW